MFFTKDSFAKAKMFSDFIGFHIRFVFCVTFSALTAPFIYMVVFNNFSVPDIGIFETIAIGAVSLLFISYSLVLYLMILQTGLQFFSRNEGNLSYRSIFKSLALITWLFCTVCLVVVLVVVASLQADKLVGLKDGTISSLFHKPRSGEVEPE